MIPTFMYMSSARGQAHLAQTEYFKTLKQGVELYKQGKYNVAYQYFENYIKEAQSAELAKPTADLAEAIYYKAVSAKYSNSPLAEDLLLEYLDKYAGSEKVYEANYQLGDLYFAKANYKDAIKYFDLSSKEALTAEDYDDLLFKKAFSYFALKDFKNAYTAFSPIIHQQDSKNQESALYYSGLSAYYLKKYDQAIESFKKLEDSKKYGSIVPYYIASIQFYNKQYDAMIDYVQPQLESNKNLRYTNELKKLLGNAFFEQKKYDLAEQYLEESLPKLNKVKQEDYFQLGEVYYRNQKYDKAIEQFKKLSTQDNEMIQNAMFMLGQCYTQLKDYPNAKAAFQQAARMKYYPKITEESLFNISKITYAQGNNTEALTLLKNFIDTYPKSKYNSEAQDMLADVFFKTRSYEEAIGLIEKMKSPNNQIKASYQKMSYYRAMELYSNGQLFKSDEYLNKSLKYTIDQGITALSYYWKADIAHTNGQYDISNDWLSKFSSIAATIPTEYSTRVSSGTGFYLQGYNSYKKKDFVSAQILFSKAIDRLKSEKDPVIQQTIYPDAVLRLADSYYMQKKYSEALANYNQVLNSKIKGADYAMYQSAMLKGLLGQTENKINGLKNTVSTYPTSTYADDALFELGNVYNNTDRGEEAVNSYISLIKNYPQSEFVPYAYNRVGLIRYNQGKMDDALASYKYVIQKYPKTTASQEALIAIKDIYIDKGDPDGYFKLIKQYPGVEIRTSAQDSIVYQAAETQYIKGNYEFAIKGFDAYINTYTNGAFILPAHFYRAESYYFTGKQIQALPDYEYVVNRSGNKFAERATLKAAVINFDQKNYRNSGSYYESLIKLASTEDIRNQAILGALRAYYQVKDYNKVLDYANQVTQNKGTSETINVEATFYRGIAEYNNGSRAEASTDLSSVIKRINNEWAAESKYTLIQIAYQNNDLKNAESQCFEFISNYPSYPEWLVKTYILLSDIYVAQKDYFKAKTTLQSVVDTYNKRDELYDEAKLKLQKVKDLESQNSKIINPDNASGFSGFEK